MVQRGREAPDGSNYLLCVLKAHDADSSNDEGLRKCLQGHEDLRIYDEESMLTKIRGS
jgi:hypothetical protein